MQHTFSKARPLQNFNYEKGLEPTLRQLIYSSNLILSFRLIEQQPLTANVGI